MGLVQTQGPAVEPVTIEEAKNHLRVDQDLIEDDGLIRMLISAARRFAEDYTGRSFLNQKWCFVADRFPGAPGVSSEILLRRGPVQSIESIQYLSEGVWKNMDPSQYVLDPSGAVARVAPAAGCSWPLAARQLASVKISYAAGFGASVDKVPEEVRHWILLRMTTLYQNREEVATLSKGKIESLPFVDGLLDFIREPVI